MTRFLDARLIAKFRALHCLAFALALVAQLHAQGGAGGGVRPGGGGVVPPGGGVLPGGGGTGPGGGVIVLPGERVPPGGGVTPGTGGTLVPGGGVGGGTAADDAQIIAAPGVVAGVRTTALAVAPKVPAMAASAGQSSVASAPDATYEWNIVGGRILAGGSSPTVEFVATSPGTVTLAVNVAANGTFYTTSAQLTAISPDAAGTIAIPPTVVASASEMVSASVPPANGGDRTFRWAVSGDVEIVRGQGTATITLRPGKPGLKEIRCAVALRNLTTITLRSSLVVTGSGPPTTLTVEGGSGGGVHPAGSQIDVFADPPAPGVVFDRWVGDTAILAAGPAAVFLPHAVAIVPDAPVRLVATYRGAPEWNSAKVANFNSSGSSPAASAGTTLIHHSPPAPRAILFLLHDSGGAADEWFERGEPRLLVRTLVAAGYAVAALNSTDRINHRWAVQPTLAANADALNHLAAADWLATVHGWPEPKPVFLLGLGGGGEAAARFAELLAPHQPVRGVVLYGAAGSEKAAMTSGVPHLFVLAPDDVSLGIAGQETARTNSRLLAGRGIATDVLASARSPVHPGRLRTVSVTQPAVAPEAATQMWEALKAAGLLDVNDYPRPSISSVAVQSALPASFRAYADDVEVQLAIAGGLEAFTSESAPAVIGFLDQRIAGIPAPEPARLVNVATRARIGHSADSFTLAFTLAGNERTTLLIRAAGPALARFGVPTAHPAPRLEVYRGTSRLIANEGWDVEPGSAAQITAATTRVGAFAFAAGSRDAAVLLPVEPGGLAVTLRGVNGSIGDLLVEVYDVSQNSTRLHSFSALARITAEGEVVVPGFRLQGEVPRTLLVRAIGAGLTDAGLPSDLVLRDPRLSLLGRGGVPVAANNDWSDGSSDVLGAVFAAAGAFPLKSANPDAAVVSALMPGAYTVQVAAAANAGVVTGETEATGVVLFELHPVP